MFIEDGRCEREIAEILNTRGIRTDLGRPWTRGTVREVLTNEKYIGNNVYNRRSFKLKKKRVVNAPDMWVRRDGIFDPIVSPRIVLRRPRNISSHAIGDSRTRKCLACSVPSWQSTTCCPAS